MSVRSEWSVSEPIRLTLDHPVTALNVRIVGGRVNVVGTDAHGPARVEIDGVEGPPLRVTQTGSTLTVAYDDLPWKGFLQWLGGRGWERSALISVTVPTATRVEVGVVGASAVVSGISGTTDLRGVFGASTLVGLTGAVRADTVSGAVEAQAVAGELRFNSVSGSLTLLEGSGRAVQANSVSGDIVLDLARTVQGSPTRLSTVSGDIAVRLPHPVDAEIQATTTGGTVSNSFRELTVRGDWSGRKIRGRIGRGTGKLTATSVSGGITLLRRDPADEDPADAPYDRKVL